MVWRLMIPHKIKTLPVKLCEVFVVVMSWCNPDIFFKNKRVVIGMTGNVWATVDVDCAVHAVVLLQK